MSQNIPKLTIIAGPNGVGKTTFAESLARRGKISNFLNADIIARGLDLTGNGSVAVEAGKILLSETRELLINRESFSFESTLSGKNWLNFIKDAKAVGYEITVYYLILSTVELALERIKKRVSLGGHNIPEKDVRRRFIRSKENFLILYSKNADNWSVFLNDSVESELIAKSTKNSFKIINEKKLKEIWIDYESWKI